MPRRRKDRPIEELRSTWTSSADLEETLRAMFNKPAPVQSFAALPEVSENKDGFRSTSTGVVEARSTGLDNVTGTGLDEPASTGIDESASPGIVESRSTGIFASKCTGSDASESTGVVEPASTVPDDLESTGIVDLPGTGIFDLESTGIADSKSTGIDESESTGIVGPADTGVAESKSTGLPDPAIPVLAGKGLWQAEQGGGVFPSSRVRKIGPAQDALTHAEEAVYDVLWGPKNTSRDLERFSSMGYNSLCKAARVTRTNTRLIIERLIYKGFLEVHTLASSSERIPTTYRVFSYRSALDNMVRLNRTHVVRTGNGVVFVHPIQVMLDDPKSTGVFDPKSTGLVGRSDPVLAEQPNPVTVLQQSPVPVDPSNPVLAASTRLGSTSEAENTSSVVATAILNAFGFIDDDALKTLVHKCRENAPDASDEEIAELGAMTARRVVRMQNVNNHVGLLIAQTAKCFLGEPFALYRRQNTERDRQLAEMMQEYQGREDQ
jgi:hypothetical protein